MIYLNFFLLVWTAFFCGWEASAIVKNHDKGIKTDEWTYYRLYAQIFFFLVAVSGLLVYHLPHK